MRLLSGKRVLPQYVDAASGVVEASDDRQAKKVKTCQLYLIRYSSQGINRTPVGPIKRDKPVSRARELGIACIYSSLVEPTQTDMPASAAATVSTQFSFDLH